VHPDCKGIRVALASPTYGPVDPDCAKSLRISMMVAGNHGVVWSGDASPDRMGYSAARNRAANEVFLTQQDYDGIMWVDSDMIVGPQDITNLLFTVADQGKTFLTGLYHQRLPPFKPVIYEYDEKVEKFRSCDGYPDNMVAPTGGCGFGFVYTGIDVINAIEKLPDFDPFSGWFPDKRDSGGCGEDLSFCKMANLAKKQLYVHTGIQLGHAGDKKIITKEDYLREKKRLEEEKTNGQK
jgi:hypothetical protein